MDNGAERVRSEYRELKPTCIRIGNKTEKFEDTKDGKIVRYDGLDGEERSTKQSSLVATVFALSDINAALQPEILSKPLELINVALRIRGSAAESLRYGFLQLITSNFAYARENSSTSSLKIKLGYRNTRCIAKRHLSLRRCILSVKAMEMFKRLGELSCLRVLAIFIVHFFRSPNRALYFNW